MSDELQGTYACPVCGLDRPHHHTPEDIIEIQRARHLREAFERWFASARSGFPVLAERVPPFRWNRREGGGYRRYVDPVVEVMWCGFMTGADAERRRPFGTEPRGCPTPGACSCPTDADTRTAAVTPATPAREET